ncbi:MAG: VCBS repeat-containing protein [Bacteroidaceae bacterium]|nr:VCBS repeat-containing protein [Bacteroidaceae bacterium]
MKKSLLITLATLTLSISGKDENWMARLSDSQLVSTVSIPGSHDSATGNGFNGYFCYKLASSWNRANMGTSYGEEFGRAQDLTIEQQWNIGIRAFDLRPNAGASSDYMTCNHGGLETNLKFEDVLTTFCNYLEANPSEFIVIHLLQGTGNNYVSRVEAVLQKNEYQNYILPCRSDMTVGEARKHMLILAREWDDWDSQTPLKGSSGSFRWWEETSKAENPDGSDARIVSANGNEAYLVMQDLANTTDASNQAKKQSLMTSLLDWSSSRTTPLSSNAAWVFNFASAYNQTGSIKVGLTTVASDVSKSDGYRSNACIMNGQVADYLQTRTGPTGIILMDFVGEANSTGYDGQTYNVRGDEAVQAIIDNNFKMGAVFLHAQELQWLHRGTPSIADYNNDGLMDIYYGGEVWEGNHAWDVTGRLYTQLADGTFSLEDTYASGQTGEHGLPPMVYGYSRWFDFDNDGNLDFFVKSDNDNNYQGGNQSRLYRNLGASQGYRFSYVESAAFLDGNNEHPDSYNARNNSSISFADYDRDGFSDVVQQAWGNGREAVVFHNNGDGTFTRAAELTKMTHGSVTFGDLDNDGWPDIVETGWEDGNHYCEFYIHKNNGDGTFTTQRMTDQNFTGMCNSDVCLVDLNGDGRLDIVTCGNNGGRRTDIYLNQGNFSFAHVTSHGITGIEEPVIYAADLNYDGRPDLIITGQADSQESSSENGDAQGTRIYLQKADGTFEHYSRTGLAVMNQGGLALGNLSNRGMVDALIVGNDVAATYHNFNSPTTLPSAPSGVQAVKNADGSITVTWQAASEEGLAASVLSYNIYVRDEETGNVSMILPADIATGRLKTLQDMQNAVRGLLSYTIKPKNGKRFTIGVQTIDPAFVTSAFATTTLSLTSPGDVNKDGSITIADVTALVNIILGKDNGDTPLYDHSAADVNADGIISIADVTALVNLILGK